MLLSRFAARPAPALLCLLLTATACANLPLTTSPPDAPVEPATQAYEIDDIMGAEPSDIDALLGLPALTRREGDGEFRRYTLNQCELIIILYPGDDGAHRATHIDTAAQNSGAEKPDLVGCLAAG